MKSFFLNSRFLLEVPTTLLIAMAVAGLSGCSSFRSEWGNPISAEPAAFAEDSTPVSTVLAKLGPPARVSALPDGFAFLYERTVITEFQFGLSFNQSVLRCIKAVHARDAIERETVLLTFDHGGVLRSFDQNQWREKLGGNWAVQPVFSSVSLTDPAVRQQRADQHRWGRSSLGALPETLNMAQSLRTGAHGLQLSLPSRYAGQHSPEMDKPMKPRNKKLPGLASPR